MPYPAAMDVPRSGAARRKTIRRMAWIGAVAVVVPLASVGLSRLKVAAPNVERSTLWIESVKRGPMVRQVRGLGTLVPEEILWVAPLTEGRIERILVRPGTPVRAGTVILELSNPEAEQAALDAEFQLRQAEAQLKDLRIQLQKDYLNQKAEAARLLSEYNQAKLTAERDEGLFKAGLLVEIRYKISRLAADQLLERYQIEKERMAFSSQASEAQLDNQQARLDQLRGMLELKRKQVEALHVRAGADGVLQQLAFEVGQRVSAGTALAKVAQPLRLKAELKIPETQAKDVQYGQKCEIDTRNGIIPGRVIRIDPAVREGTVTVDAKLEGPLPQGARPDLSVDGTIELERLADVVYVGRPASGQPNSVVGLFKLENGGKSAVRVPVKLGRSSVSVIEVLDGVRPGDQVVLSDMSAWDAYDRIDLK